jgi:hypothetical protein
MKSLGELVRKGYGFKRIADELNVTTYEAQKLLRKNGLLTQAQRTGTKLTEFERRAAINAGLCLAEYTRENFNPFYNSKDAKKLIDKLDITVKISDDFLIARRATLCGNIDVKVFRTSRLVFVWCEAVTLCAALGD